MPQAKQPWEYEIAPCYSKSTAEKIFKKHPQEFQNVLKNLDTYKKTLDEGVPLEQAKRTLPFVHNEQKGLLAIDQRPPKGGVQLCNPPSGDQHGPENIDHIRFNERNGS